MSVPVNHPQVLLRHFSQLIPVFAGLEEPGNAANPHPCTRTCGTTGNYKLRQGLRCNEHFDVVQLAGQDPAKCLEACLKEERCSKFSVQANGTAVRECFLFEPEAQCWEQEGWITGHKGDPLRHKHRCQTRSPPAPMWQALTPFATVFVPRADTRCGISPQNSVLNLKCPFGTLISDIKFASYGTAVGDCGNFTTGTCHEPMTKEIVADVCVGEQSCSIAASSKVFGDPCPVIAKSLRVQAVCEGDPPRPLPLPF